MHPTKLTWSPFYGVTSKRWLNWEWFDGKKPQEAFYMGTCFVQGSVFHGIRVCTKCCQLPPLQAAQYLQRNQASKPEATGRLCLSLPQKEVLCITARTSLLHVHSLLHINHCWFCMCSPGTCWEKASGKHSFILLKGSEIQLWKQLLFLFSLQHHLYSFLTWQKASIGITQFQEKNKEEWDWNPAQAGVCCPPKCCFPSFPFPSPLT